jgi:hypothetical protein
MAGAESSIAGFDTSCDTPKDEGDAEHHQAKRGVLQRSASIAGLGRLDATVG